MSNKRFFSYFHRFLPAVCLCLLFGACTLAGCGKPTFSSDESPISKTGIYFDTVISVTLYDASLEPELEHCFEMADEYEHYFSAKRADSDVTKINEAGGAPVEVHAETAELIEKGLSYSKISGGRFDITIGRLTALWDFQAEEPTVPDAADIAAAVDTVDYRKVSVDGHTVTLSDSRAAIDLGGIAKGYIADQMKNYLLSQGVESGVINLGGNVLTIKSKPDGSAYRIGIQKPFAQNGEAILAADITDQSVVSSGVYERYFEINGTRYHHILDVTTGYPYSNGLLGVTIVCDSSTDGDGLSTTCFALGLEDGMALIESLESTEAVFITEDGELHYSSGIPDKVNMQKLP